VRGEERRGEGKGFRILLEHLKTSHPFMFLGMIYHMGNMREYNMAKLFTLVIPRKLFIGVRVKLVHLYSRDGNPCSVCSTSSQQGVSPIKNSWERMARTRESEREG